ncbi:hypothetical protein A6S26_18520 [Nostoc sp. ATCC 43529]|nr:hypothetical protein A6S26_18520 [Nostoc sp. ATCC 43529]
MRAKKPHQANTFRCELSEGLAFKYFIICHLNQAHRQYVDSDALADKFLPAATPLLLRLQLYLYFRYKSS